MNEIINSLVSMVNDIGGSFFGFSAAMFIQVSLLVFVLWVIDKLLRKRVRATFRYCIWMLVLIKLILPPGLSSPTGIGNWIGDYFSVNSIVSLQQDEVADTTQQFTSIEQQELVETAATTQMQPSRSNAYSEPEVSVLPEIRLTEEIPTAAGVSELPQPLEVTQAPRVSAVVTINTLTWQSGIFLVWLLGISILFALLIQRILFVRGLITQSKPAKEELVELLGECRRQLGIRRNIELKQSHNASSPAVCGIFRPVILIPTELLGKVSREKLRAVLIHELSHIKRRDLWVNCAQTILQILYFYNPFVWLANTVVRRNREQAVDEMVLVALGAEAKSYSDTLIDIAEMAFSRPALSLRLVGVVESKKALSDRIKHIVGRPLPKSAKLGILGLLTVVIIAAILLPMAKSYRTTTLGGLYEKAKVSKDFKVKAGPTTFSVNGVVRWIRDGNVLITDPANKNLLNATNIPDYSKQAAWMDIAQVYISPGIDKYEAIELRIFDHSNRKILSYEDYVGIGYNIQNSIVTIYSVGQLLPDELDVWLRVIHKSDENKIIRVPAQVNAVANLENNTLKILEIKEGMYNRSSNSEGINWTQHHSEYDETATSVDLQFAADNHNNRRFQICAVSKDGQRYVPTGAPHFISSANGRHHVIEIGFPKEQIDYFEISPFISRDTFYFDGVKLPKVSNLFAPCPQVTFNIDDKEGEFVSNILSPIELKLYAYSNKEITSTYASAENWGNIFTIGQAEEGTSSFAFKVNGMRTNNIQLAYYDMAGKRIDPDKNRGGSWSSGGTTTIKTDSVNIPLEQIDVVSIRISEEEIQEQYINSVKPSQFTATLPNGGTCELVGIRRASEPNQPWYSPDGRVQLDESDEIFSHLTSSSGIVNVDRTQTYEFYVHCDLPSNTTKKVVKNKWSFEPVQEIRGSFFKSFSLGQHYFSASCGFPDTLEKVDATFEVSNGQWKTITQHDGQHDKEITITHRGQRQNITLGEIVETNGSVTIEITHLIKEMTARVIIVDNFGNTREPLDNVLDWADSEGNILITKCRFDGMTADRIDHYELQIQPIDIVTIKDISLKDNVYTNPSISVSSITDEIPISARVEAAFMGPEFGQYAASLPSGVTVELLGVCEHPSQGKQWWRPDGSLMKDIPYDRGSVTLEASTGRQANEIAVLISNCDESSDISLTKGSHLYGGGKCRKDNRIVQGLRNVIFDHDKNIDNAEIKLGIAAGSWATIQTQEADFSGVYSTQSITWHRPIESASETVLNVAYADSQMDVRIIAIDIEGKEHIGSSFGGGQKDVKSVQTAFPMFLSDIKEFQFQTRPYEWITFKNISLEPGLKTDVKIEDENPAGQNEGLIAENVYYVTKDDMSEIADEFGGDKLFFNEEDSVWEIEKPFKNIHRPDFNFYITADKVITQARDREGDPVLEQVTLTGNVVIHIEPSGTSDINEFYIYLDNLAYTSDKSLLSSSGPVKMISGDSQLLGTDMELRYNDEHDEINSDYSLRIVLENVQMIYQSNLNQENGIAQVDQITLQASKMVFVYPNRSEDEEQWAGMNMSIFSENTEATIKTTTGQGGIENQEISGLIRDPNGNPAANAQVALSTDTVGVLIKDGRLEENFGSESRIVQTDSQGRFNLGQVTDESFTLIAAGDDGFAQIEYDNPQSSYDIQLQPWGRIEGQLAQGRGANGNQIWMTALPYSSMWEYRYETRCDVNRRFIFEKVPASWFDVGYLISTGMGSGGYTSRRRLEVKANQTSTVILGGEGRPVTGKFIFPEGYEKPSAIDGYWGLVTTMAPEPRPEDYDQMPTEQQQQWRTQWRQTEDYKKYREDYFHDENWRQYTFYLNEDGTFRIEDVIPGKYNLNVTMFQKKNNTQLKEVALEGSFTIEVPQIQEVFSDKPFDLGELELEIYDSPEAETPAGQNINEDTSDAQIETAEIYKNANVNDKSINISMTTPEGEPIAGVQIYKYYSFHETTPSRRPEFESDERGLVSFQKDDLFQGINEDEKFLLYALGPSQQYVGFLEISSEDTDRQIDWQLQTACKVSGRLESSTLRKLGQSLDGANVYVYKDNYRPLFYNSFSGQFDFLLPEGDYRLYAYGSSTYSMSREIEIETGQKELRIEFDLPADRLAALIGNKAPEFSNIKGWINSEPLELEDLRGKVVLLDFWGYWCGPCIAAMPNLMQIHEQFSEDDLVIIAVHDDSLESVEQLQEKLDELSRDRWSGRQITFAIALDGGGETKIEGSDRTSRGTTTASYGIQRWPTSILIDKNGNVVREFSPRNPDAVEELQDFLGEQFINRRYEAGQAIPTGWVGGLMKAETLDEQPSIHIYREDNNQNLWPSEKASVDADENGNYAFFEVPFGDYWLRVDFSNNESFPMKTRFLFPVKVNSSQQPKWINLNYEGGSGNIEVTCPGYYSVTAYSYNENMKCWIEWDKYLAKSLPGNKHEYLDEYEFTNLPAGSYGIVAVRQQSNGNVITQHAQLELKEDENLSCTLPIENGSAVLEGTVSGFTGDISDLFVIVRKPGSGPIEFATIYEASTRDSIAVIRAGGLRPDGSYECSELPAGEYTITAAQFPSRYRQYRTPIQQVSKTVVLKENQITTVDFDLSPVLNIEGAESESQDQTDIRVEAETPAGRGQENISEQNEPQIIIQADVITIARSQAFINGFLSNELGLDNPVLAELTNSQVEKFREWASSIPETTIVSSPNTLAIDGQPSEMNFNTINEFITGYQQDANSPSDYKALRKVIKTGIEIVFTPELRPDNQRIVLDMNIGTADIADVIEKTHESGNQIRIPVVERQKISSKVALQIGKYSLLPVAGLESPHASHTFLIIKAELQNEIETE